MVVAFNNALLRGLVSSLGRALYLIDFEDKKECCPSKINELLSEVSGGSTRSNVFDIPNMELLFRDSNFKHIFTKNYVGNSNFSVKKRYVDYYDYHLVIRESRIEIIKFISHRLQLSIGDMNEFVTKFTVQFIKDYDNRIEHLNNLELKNKKIKEELDQFYLIS